MTRRPFGPGELGDRDPDLERVAEELEGYARLTANEVPRNLADRVMGAVAREERPRRGLLAGWLAALGRPRQSTGLRAVLVAATMAVAILAVLAAGQLGNLFGPRVGSSPEPTVIETRSPSPSPSAESSLTPTASPVPSTEATPTAAQTAGETTTPSADPSVEASESESPKPATPRPTVQSTETPEPSGSETPEPSGGSSGSGGGSGDDSN